jgi:cytosine/uracil/thiamine/allantoin permease
MSRIYRDTEKSINMYTYNRYPFKYFWKFNYFVFAHSILNIPKLSAEKRGICVCACMHMCVHMYEKQNHFCLHDPEIDDTFRSSSL